jgi:hypothetical protein
MKYLKFMWGLLFFLFAPPLTSADIAILTIAHGKEYQQCVKPGTESKRAYCQKHGYDFIYCEDCLDPSRPICWSKILLALEVMENSSYRWLVWIDADTLIMNHDILLEDLIDERFNFCISRDFLEINAGVFFIRNCNWSKRLFCRAYSRTDCLAHYWQEQTAIITEMQKPQFIAKVKIVPQRTFNSYPPETVSSPDHTYQPGDFLLHFAGIHNLNVLSSMFQKYSN